MTGGVSFVFLLTSLVLPANAKYIQLDAVADIKTRFSSGCSSVQELANVSQHRGIDVVIYSDHDRASLEFGIFPLERIVKKKKEQYSILTSGAAAYLSEINTNDKTFPETLLIPAVESAPFYYWEGTLADENLTAHNWDKHLLVIGLKKASDYEQLPILNSNFSLAYYDHFALPFMILAGLFLVSAVLFYKRIWRKTFFFLTVLFLLLTINNHPFRSSPFDPYSGDLGIAPYQELIDYAVSKGAMVFWNHLESTAGVGKNESVGLSTLPHPEDLLLSTNYTGFEAVYDGEVHVTDPGQQWDQVLKRYIEGKRSRPVWGYGGNDFVCEGEMGRTLGGVRTILLVKEKTREAVLQAMRVGRMYALKQSTGSRLSLDEFTVSNSRGMVVMGEELVAIENPELKIKIRSKGGTEDRVALSIIRDGTVVKQETAALPYELVWKDTDVKRQGKVYYRLKAEVSSENYLVSNPIFVKFSEEDPPVASLPQEETQPVIDPTPPRPPKAPAEPEKNLVEREHADGIQPPSLSQTPAVSSHSEDAAIGPDNLNDVVAEPSLPSADEPATTAIRPPSVEAPQPPELPEVESPFQEPGEPFVVALIDGVTLKRGPGVRFPQIATAKKGERMVLLRKLKAMHNGKPWLEVKKGQRKVYVWEGLVKISE
ncbi:MAG: hypothetical protein VYC17_06345 [Nitrospinota bacterium]|nr:hypothetical protein [Nitrospinota bacterium]